MKRILLLFVCGFLAGCDYTVPLVTTPTIPIDESAVGLWQRRTAEGQTEQLLILPLDKLEYLVSYPAGAKDAIFARACLCRIGEKTLIQLKWFGTAEAGLPEDQRVFQYVSYTAKGDRLTARLLNPDVVTQNVASSQDLARLITANLDRPNLFKEPMVFAKVKK